MNKAIHFKTSIFDVSKEKKNPINPIYGVSLLYWLKDLLKENIQITEPFAEDWGWCSELEWENNNYLIGSSVFYEEEDNPNIELEWIFQIDKKRSLKDIFLGKNKMNENDSCFMFFKNLFESEPNFNSVEIA